MTAPDDLLARTRRLIDGDRLTAPTREALKARLERVHGTPRTFDPGRMATLRAAAARLVPEPDLAEAVDLAGALDAQLAESPGDGWRYADQPPDVELHRLGLEALDAAARSRFASGFAASAGEQQDELLKTAADGGLALPGAPNSARWFEELLSALVELHYAHPLVQVAIGYDGMADARGFQAVGLAAVAAEARRDG